MGPTTFKMTRRRQEVFAVLAGGGAWTGWELMQKTGRTGPTVYAALDVLREHGWVRCEWLPAEAEGAARMRIYWIPDALLNDAKMLLVEHVRLV